MEPVVETRAQFMALLREHMPFYFHEQYDAPEARRAFRDQFLRGALVRFLAAVEWRRNVHDPRDLATFWTVDELYVACQTLWLTLVSKRIDRDEKRPRGLESIADQMRKWVSPIVPRIDGVQLHFHWVQHQDIPSEDRFVPFGLEEVDAALNVLVTEGAVQVLSNASLGARRHLVDVTTLHEKRAEIKVAWKARPGHVAEGPSLKYLFFCMDHGQVDALCHAVSEVERMRAFPCATFDFAMQGLATGATSSSVVTLAELLVHGNELVNRTRAFPGLPMEPSLVGPTSLGVEVPLIESDANCRTIIERLPYHCQSPARAQLSEAHHQHGRNTMEAVGVQTPARMWCDVMVYVPPLSDERRCASTRVGYRLVQSPPPAAHEAAFPLPTFSIPWYVSVAATGQWIESAAALIEFWMRGAEEHA